MVDKQMSSKPKAIILNKTDNIVIALNNMNAGD